ncbi:MAG: ferredoxin--NADP reductase [Pedobacter sp.]|nr:MAG: ferredoxin--NADP reductase [Pedobacter sp.]
MTTFDLQVKSITQEASEVLKISFEVLGEQPFKYQAGQFLTLIFNRGDKELRRSYSFCSAPDVDEDLAIAVKLVENGEISRFLHHQLSVGEILQAVEPNGNFTYVPESLNNSIPAPKYLFLFAAGVGITPLFSILKSALHQESQTQVILVYSSRNADAVIFANELQELEEAFRDRLHLVYLFSESKLLSKARLNGILLRDIVKQYLKGSMSQALFYTCGPVDYMDMCRITLLSAGFGTEQIKRETFVLPEDEIDEDDNTERVVDKNTYSVILQLRGETYQFDVPYPKRILDVALENKIAVPYSCSGGVCSTCAATCIKGGVRMDYNEVLTDAEVAQGRVLICTGHPTENQTIITWS